MTAEHAQQPGSGPHFAAAATPVRDIDLEPGLMVGEYSIVGRVGEGGMGVVYEGVHPVIGKRVAIKVLKAEMSRRPDVVERFVAEAASVNQICHQNIVDVFAFGQLPDGRHYFVMEFLVGESLFDLLERRGRLQLARALPILRQLGAALDAAHAKAIVHRDLKPDNIFLIGDRAAQVKVLDFGIAKLAPGDTQRTQTGMVMGTPLFMSPEQCRGQQVDHRTDVYAFGVLLYRILTGYYPFDSDTIATLIFHHIASAVRPPSELGAPADLDPILNRALAKKSSERYPSVGAVVSDLARLGGGDPAVFDHDWIDVELPPGPLEEPALPEFGVDGVAVPVAPAVAASPVASEVTATSDTCMLEADAAAQEQGGSTSITGLGGLTPTPDPRLETHAGIDAGGSRRLRGHSGKVRRAVFSPDGVHVATASADHSARLWDRGGRSEAVLSGHDAAVEHVAFSPDGQLLASGGNDGRVQLWRLAEQRSLRVLRGHKKAITALAFTHDGGYIVSASRDGTLRAWSTEDPGRSPQVLKGHEGIVRCLACAPDRRRVASGGDDQTVRLWELESGRRTILRGHSAAVYSLVFRPDGARLASAGGDGTIREWTPRLTLSAVGDAAQRVIEERKGIVRAIAYSPDGEVIASAGADGVVRLWGANSKLPLQLEGHEGKVHHVTFSADGALLASASLDTTVRVWEVARRRAALVIDHPKPATYAAFSPDGQLVATCSSSSDLLLTRIPAREDSMAGRAAEAPAAAPQAGARGPSRVSVMLFVVALVAAAGAVAFLLQQ